MENYACRLPLELKIKILMNLPYEDVRFITDLRFWTKYWKTSKACQSTGEFEPNPEQSYVLKLLERGENVFVNAPAGTGKSALITHFFRKHQHWKSIGLTATTGISAININGYTLHSFLGIKLGIESVEELHAKILKNKAKLKLWLQLDVLVIDEISMLHPKLFDKLEKLARKLRETSSRFGGIQLAVFGDLFQLPCISLSNEDQSLIVDSKQFRKCIDITVKLTNVVRQPDPIFKVVLGKIRLGIVDEQVKSIITSRMSALGDELIRPTMLYCTRKCVNNINDRELDKLAAEGREFREYTMKFTQLETKVPRFEFDYVCANFAKHSTTLPMIQICENAQVMLTYNISSTLVNGSRGVVTGFTEEDYPIVTFLNKSSVVIIPVKFSLYHGVKTIGHAIQIPLKIAYALTIHSSQGATLDYAHVDLSDAFEYGQAYTALSRVRTLDGLFVKKFDFRKIAAHPRALDYWQSE